MIGQLSLLSKSVLLLTLALFAALTATQLTAFGAPWGVTAAPDMRWAGYHAEEIVAFFEAIGPEGKDIFFGRYRWLDTLFPPLLAISLIILFRAVRVRRSGYGIALFALLPMGYLVADLVENDFLKDMVDPSMIAQEAHYAADATMVKFAVLALALLALMAAALRARLKQV